MIGAHAVLLRTADLDVPMAPTGDGDLGVTPGLVGDLPGIETLLLGAGYQHRTTARPGLWGRTPYVDRLGGQQFREKIDLLPRMACAARPAELDAGCLRGELITASSRSVTLSGSNSLHSTGPP